MALIVPQSIDLVPEEKWVRYDADTEVLLRGLDDESYQIALARAKRQISKADGEFKTGEVGLVDGEITEHAYQCKLLSKFIIRNWRGAKDADGRDVPYNPEVGEQALRADVDFVLFVLKEAGSIALDAAMVRKETLGKSLPATDGKSSGKS